MYKTKEKYMCIVDDCYSTARFGYKIIFNTCDNEKNYIPCKNYMKKLDNRNEYVLVEYCNKHSKMDMVNLIDKVCKLCLLKKINDYNELELNGCCVECYNKNNYNKINYKNKEIAVKQYLTDYITEYKFINDKCLKFNIELPYRPDFQLEINNKIIIIEIDENQHSKYSVEKEEKRNIKIKKAGKLYNKQIIIIRFNPDNYKKGNQLIVSPWKNNKIENEDEWINRLNTLKETILLNINSNDNNYSIIKLFYDE